MSTTISIYVVNNFSNEPKGVSRNLTDYYYYHTNSAIKQVFDGFNIMEALSKQ
jgi:hypothetical protein